MKCNVIIMLLSSALCMSNVLQGANPPALICLKPTSDYKGDLAVIKNYFEQIKKENDIAKKIALMQCALNLLTTKNAAEKGILEKIADDKNIIAQKKADSSKKTDADIKHLDKTSAAITDSIAAFTPIATTLQTLIQENGKKTGTDNAINKKINDAVDGLIVKITAEQNKTK